MPLQTLASGARVGPYDVIAPLGAGGMGEVSLARDTNLQRDAALKVPPEGLAANHPNIAGAASAAATEGSPQE